MLKKMFGGGGNIVSSIIGGGLGMIGAHQNNVQARRRQGDAQNFAREEADRDRAWMEEQSSTAYQTAMTDMRAAGLNPMLAFQQGGASGGRPAGQSPAAGAPMENVVDKGISSAFEKRRVKMEADRLQSDIDLSNVQEELGTQQAKLVELEQSRAQRETEQIETQTAIERAQIPAVRAEAEARRQQAKQTKKYMEVDNMDPIRNSPLRVLPMYRKLLEAIKSRANRPRRGFRFSPKK